MNMPGMDNLMNGANSSYDMGGTSQAGGYNSLNFGGHSFGGGGLSVSTPVLIGLAVVAAVVIMKVVK